MISNILKKRVILNLLFLLPLIFLTFSCEEKVETGCHTDSECNGKICFYNECYEKDDKVLGIKTIHLIGNPNVPIVAGEEKTLKAQVVLAPTKEMREKFKDHEDYLKELLGPIKDAKVTFKIISNGTTATIEPEKVTDDLGIVKTRFVAGNENSNRNLNVSVISEDCKEKRFTIHQFPRMKKLSIITTDGRVYINGKKNIIAQVLTNGDYPYADQEVKFKIAGNSSGSNASIEPITVTTNFAGIAKVELNAGDKVTKYRVVASAVGTQEVSLDIDVLERNGGCFGDEDCKHLGDLYQCKETVCVFVPKPCNDKTDCPDNYICNDDKKCEVKPFICDENELDSCRCIKSKNCPNNLSCVRHRCIQEDKSCENHTECPNGLLCLKNKDGDKVCKQRGRQCKVDSNCFALHQDKCPTEESCVCEDGYCINPCPDINYIELSGGSGKSCHQNSDCFDENGNDIGEICFTAHGINKCIVRWNAVYDFHLIDALPPTLQSILSGAGRLLGPISDIIVGEDIDWGLPGWLSWLEEGLVALAKPYLDQYVPQWVQKLVVGLDNSIDILKEMRVNADMAFVHNEDIHSDIKGFEFWDTFYVEWDGNWTEVRPNSEDDGDDFQINSSPFTGSISCQKLESGESKYVLYIDRHSAEFYFGRFVKAFIDNLLIPSVTSDKAHNIGEVLDIYVDCVSIGKSIKDAAIEHLGDWAEYLPEDLITGACEMAKDAIETKIYEKLAELKFGNAENESDKFTFEGKATIKTKGSSTEGIKLTDGVYTGTLDVAGERNFSADWKAQKER